MRIAIDARPLSHPQAGGFRSYLLALITGLRERTETGVRDETLLLYLDRPLTPDIAALLPPGAETRVLGTSRLSSDLLLFPRQVRQDRPDLVMGTSNYLPFGLTPSVTQVVTIHDAMGVKAYPWDVGVRRNARERFINRYWAWQTRRSARRARLVLTVSQGSARELAGAIGLPTGAFRVVYNGIRLPIVPDALVARDAATVLAIESPDPRKNVRIVYPMMAAVTAREGAARLRIVANGERARERARAGAGTAGTDVEMLTDLSDADLAMAYRRATVFVWPSRLEGFGLPPLEAMAWGCPVVSSNAPVMPEILGDIPLYAGSDDIDAFADAVTRLLRDPADRADRTRRGRLHAATFTCRRMADETVAVWQEALNR
jgi:glycosyltransferase involved in cell wall biosynthesis